MWARRQASETAIHRFDAEQARGTRTHFEATFSTDMLDELLCGFAARTRTTDVGDGLEPVIHVHAHDTDEHWYITVGATETNTTRTGDHGDLTLTGDAADLYVLLWNRTPNSPPAMSGDADLMELWRENFRVRWS